MTGDQTEKTDAGIPTWRCPPPRPLMPEEQDRVRGILDAMVSIPFRPANIVGATGLELRLAVALMTGDIKPLSSDNDFWIAKCRALLLRAAIEPILWSYWTRLKDFEMDGTVAMNFAGALAGRAQAYRTGPLIGRSRNGDVKFEPPGEAGQWLYKIQSAAAAPELRTMLPIFVFAQTIMSHPFPDANGRLARAFVHGALAKITNVSEPRLGLAPSFYMNAESLAQGFRDLSETKDWAPFIAAFLATLEDSVEVTKALASILQ